MIAIIVGSICLCFLVFVCVGIFRNDGTSKKEEEVEFDNIKHTVVVVPGQQ